MRRNYYIVSPFPEKNNGVTNYVEYTKDFLKENFNLKVIYNKGLKVNSFENYIKKIVGDDYTAIVELPDCWGLFAYKKVNFIIHVRLHGSLLLLQRINFLKPNFKRYQREIALIQKAHYISTPSMENIHGYRLEPKRLDIANFPNPVQKCDLRRVEKKIDIVFIGRFDLVKGADYFAELLAYLNHDFNIYVIGISNEEMRYYSIIKYFPNIKFLGWISNKLKNEILLQSKTCIILSRFESYSLVAAEAIVSNTTVYAWDVGGIKENFGNYGIQLFDEGDCLSMAEKIINDLDSFTNITSYGKKFIQENNEAYINGVLSMLSNNFNLKNNKRHCCQVYNNDFIKAKNNVLKVYQNEFKKYDITLKDFHLIVLPWVKGLRQSMYFIIKNKNQKSGALFRRFLGKVK